MYSEDFVFIMFWALSDLESLELCVFATVEYYACLTGESYAWQHVGHENWISSDITIRGISSYSSCTHSIVQQKCG